MMYQWPLLCACWFKVYIINYANSLGFVIRTQYNDDDWLVCAFTALMMKYNVGTYLASRVYVSFIFCFDFVLFFVSILLWFVFGVGGATRLRWLMGSHSVAVHMLLQWQ